MKISKITLILASVLSLMTYSCNNNVVSEKVRDEVEKINWEFSEVNKVHIHGTGSRGGSESSNSTFSLAASLIAPSGSILPDDSVDILIEKISDAVKEAGAKIVIAEKDNGITYTEHSENFDKSAHIFKIIYKANDNIGSITGTLIKRRYSDDKGVDSETVGQLLLSLHEER